MPQCFVQSPCLSFASALAVYPSHSPHHLSVHPLPIFLSTTCLSVFLSDIFLSTAYLTSFYQLPVYLCYLSDCYAYPRRFCVCMRARVLNPFPTPPVCAWPTTNKPSCLPEHVSPTALSFHARHRGVACLPLFLSPNGMAVRVFR
jgi:hypothetical protein